MVAPGYSVGEKTGVIQVCAQLEEGLLEGSGATVNISTQSDISSDSCERLTPSHSS